MLSLEAGNIVHSSLENYIFQKHYAKFRRALSSLCAPTISLFQKHYAKFRSSYATLISSLDIIFQKHYAKFRSLNPSRFTLFFIDYFKSTMLSLEVK